MIISVAVGFATAPGSCGGGPTRCRANAPSSRAGARRRLRGGRRRQGARATVLADRDICEDRLGYLARLVRGEMTPPRLDADGHRAVPCLNQLAIAADLVSDKHRLM